MSQNYKEVKVTSSRYGTTTVKVFADRKPDAIDALRIVSEKIRPEPGESIEFKTYLEDK